MVRQKLTGKFIAIPVECGVGATTFGCENGPAALHEAEIIETLAEKGHDIQWLRTPQWHELKDKDAFRGREHARRDMVYRHLRRLVRDVRHVLGQGGFPVTIGGDHSLAAGSIRALAEQRKAHGNIGVLWIDAHPDLNTLKTSHSKSVHGMSLAALLGLVKNKKFAGEKTVLNGRHVCVIGARDVDAPEWEHARKTGATIITMEQVRKNGAEASLEQAWQIISRAGYRTISFDLDSLSPLVRLSTRHRLFQNLSREFTLSTGTPVNDGFLAEDIIRFFKTLRPNRDIHLLDIVEFNPHLGDRDQTTRLIGELLHAAIS